VVFATKNQVHIVVYVVLNAVLVDR